MPNISGDGASIKCCEKLSILIRLKKKMLTKPSKVETMDEKGKLNIRSKRVTTRGNLSLALPLVKANIRVIKWY